MPAIQPEESPVTRFAVANRVRFGPFSAMSIRRCRLLATVIGVAYAFHSAPAPDSVTLKILTDTGSRVTLDEPVSPAPGTIYNGLAALGYTDPTPRHLRLTTDNRAIPATVNALTVEAWPLLERLTTKGLLAAGVRGTYYPPIDDPDFEMPRRERIEREYPQTVPQDIIYPPTRPPWLMQGGYAWAIRDQPEFDSPNFERPKYDYSGPPLTYQMPPELLQLPVFATNPAMVRLFIQTNIVGLREASERSVSASRPIRRLRPASYWDAVEPPNNPRAVYDRASDFEDKARQTTKALFDLRDPSNPTSPSDPRPSYDSRPYYNPQFRR